MKIGKFLQNLGHSAVYYPKLAKVMGGATASIFFFQLLQWQAQLQNSHAWVIISYDKIEEETGLSRSEQEFARRQLLERSLIKERLVNGDSNAIELLPDIDIFEKLLDNFNEDNYRPAEVEVVDNHYNPTRQIKTDRHFGQPRQPISVAVTPHYQFSGPWKSQEELKKFQRALEEYAINQNLGYSSPSGWAFKIIDGISKGLPSTFWDEFVAGIPLGESQKIKRDWEIEPGVAYPAFEEERIQYYVHKGEPLEAAVAKARKDLRDPVLGKDLWEGFLRKCDRIADDAIKSKNLGVQTPYLPPAFTEKPTITKESVMSKLAAIAPQASLPQSNPQSLPAANPETEEINDIPTLASLQTAYKTSMGRTLVERQIAQHPEWGYEIVNGEVVESIPF